MTTNLLKPKVNGSNVEAPNAGARATGRQRRWHPYPQAATATWRFGLLLLLILVAASFHARAVLPEPDNVFFGAIVREGVLVTAADYDVVIEARRTPTGPPIASYQMGGNPRVGDFFSLRVKLESISPVLDADATQTNDLIYIVVRDFNGDLQTTNLLMSQRGTFRRVDFGSATNPDSDGDGLPDAWELNNGITGNGSGDRDGDGVSDRNEYIAGTNPNQPDDTFKLAITNSGPNSVVSFLARRAEGVGYENVDRFYFLESTTNVVLGPWLDVPSRTNILGNNSTVTYQVLQPAIPPAFYRGRALLRPR